MSQFDLFSQQTNSFTSLTTIDALKRMKDDPLADAARMWSLAAATRRPSC
jgi:hypothetical protein